MKKKLLITTGIFTPDIGGPATYAKTLLNKLSENNFDIKIITYSDLAGKDKENIFRILRNQNCILRYFKFFWQTFQLAKWADIIYAQGPISEGLPTYLACKLLGKKYKLKITGDQAWERLSQKDNLITPDLFQNKKFYLKT